MLRFPVYKPLRRFLDAVLVTACVLFSLGGYAQDYDVLSQGVVKIVSRSPGGQLRTGTGFIVKLEPLMAYIVTAAHVVAGDSEPTIYFAARRNVPVTGRVVKNDLGLDVSLLLVQGRDNLPAGTLAIGLARGQTIKRGEQVATIGFPAGLGDWAVTSSTIGTQEGSKLTLSGTIAEGNSGGPVLRGDNVVAMITSVQGIAGLAIPALFLDYTLKGWGVEAAERPGPAVAATTPVPVTTPTAPARKPALKAGDTFKDCDDCPEMVVVPAGQFRMGSPDGEKGRQPDESPVHQVTIPADFAVSKFEITRGQFARFVRATGRNMSGSKWLDPGFRQADDHPVVYVSFEDANAYAEWLAKETGKPYRLLSEAEWEYAARAGMPSSRYWGDGEEQACTYANVADRQAKAKHPGWTTFDCDDGYPETAPVGKFRPNAFRLYDMLGNVSEWTQDCWNGSYQGAPINGSAWLSGECNQRVVRGGSWSIEPGLVRSADRDRGDSDYRIGYLGFRVSRTLP
jgi:formylglycine-generating enzyme required for sulfatase activity